MKTQFIELANEGVSLTAYILDSSPELSNWEKRPAVLVIPGGAYKFCSDREAEPIAMAFCARGYNAFVLRLVRSKIDLVNLMIAIRILRMNSGAAGRHFPVLWTMQSRRFQ